MPSPLLQLRIPQDLADWLEAKHPSRGEVAAYVRQLLTAEQMKEAVAPLVPEDVDDAVGGALKGIQITQDLCAMRGHPLISGLGECLCGLEKQAPTTPNEFDAHKAKPKARRKKVTVGDLESDEPIDLMVALKASVEAMKAQTPQRCNRGACTGTINPVKGRCVRCNQTPWKESK